MKFLLNFKLCFFFLLIVLSSTINICAMDTLTGEGVAVTNVEQIQPKAANFNPGSNNKPQTALEILFISVIFFIGFVIIFITSLNLILKLKDKQKTNVISAPGSTLSKIANLLPKRYAKDLIQNISDMRLEYCEALSEKKVWRAKCVVAFYYVGLSWSVMIWIADKVKKVIGIVPKMD